MSCNLGNLSRWLAAPAFLAIAAGALLTIFVVFAGAESRAADLKAKAEAATASHNHSAAVLRYRHLLAIEPNEPSHAMGLAVALDRSKRRAEAMAVLSTIATANGAGYPPAHLQLAEWTAESRVMGNAIDQQTIDAAIHHARAAQADPALRGQAETLVDILNGMRGP